MENQGVWELLIRTIPAILASVGALFAGYYAYSIKKKGSDYKSISQLQEHISVLMDRNEKQDTINDELRKNNTEQTIAMTRLIAKLETMQQEVDDLKVDLESERREKHLYKEKFEKEHAEKLFMLKENKQMRTDIENLKSEISSLKAQLGIITK